MKHSHLDKWLSGVEKQRSDLEKAKRSLEYSSEDRPPKRRDLGARHTPQRRTKSAPPPLLWGYISAELPVEVMAERKRMAPPPTPPTIKSSKSRRSSTSGAGAGFGGVDESSGNSTTITTALSNYRDEVLRPNGVIFRQSRYILPRKVKDAVRQCEECEPCANFNAITHDEAEELLATLDTEETTTEAALSIALRTEHIFPAKRFYNDLRFCEGLIFSRNGLPRNPYPDKFQAISAPKPDYAYGYQSSAFSIDQLAAAQSFLYKPCMATYWPFLVIEVKSQSMGKNCFQAANQCAGGGTVCVSAMATLLDRAYGTANVFEDGTDSALGRSTEAAPFPSTILNEDATVTEDAGMSTKLPHEAIAFSLAVDSRSAELYVHWRGTDKRSFFLKRICGYVVIKTKDLCQMQRKLEQIIAWGMGPRLTAIKAALDRDLLSQVDD